MDLGLKERVGIDVGSRLPVVDAVEWAADNDVRYVDVNVDDRIEGGFRDAEVAAIREICEDRGVHLGLHPSSAVNAAETAPFVDGAVDRYLDAYVEIAERLGAEWIVAHGGYHFSADADERFEAGLARLSRAAEDAADRGVELLLENHNPEPEAAEIHYLPATPGECARCLDALDVGWAFNPPHAHLHPAGIEGFVDALSLERCGEVRLNDNRGRREEHLPPGEGTIDFAALFDLVEGAGYEGHYVLAFGTLEGMLDGREYLLDAVGEG